MAQRKKRTNKLWSHSEGKYGKNKVWVFESRKGGMIHARINGRKQSLGHRNREQAQQWAEDQAAKLRLGVESAPSTGLLCRESSG